MKHILLLGTTVLFQLSYSDWQKRPFSSLHRSSRFLRSDDVNRFRCLRHLFQGRIFVSSLIFYSISAKNLSRSSCQCPSRASSIALAKNWFFLYRQMLVLLIPASRIASLRDFPWRMYLQIVSCSILVSFEGLPLRCLYSLTNFPIAYRPIGEFYTVFCFKTLSAK